MKQSTKITAVVTACAMSFAALALGGCNDEEIQAPAGNDLVLSYSFDEASGTTVKESVAGTDSKIAYVFNTENQANLLKPASEPLRRKGVSGNALYLDGNSTYVANDDFRQPKNAFTVSAWVAPRVFENLPNYESVYAAGNTRLTSIVNKGDIDMGEGFLLGYGRLGLWGIQLAVYNKDTDEESVLSFYDPINALSLYEWSHVAVSYDGKTGYIALFYNGVRSYEAVIPELANTEIVLSDEPLYIGRYANPTKIYGLDTQMVAGLLDEVRIYDVSLSPKQTEALYLEGAENGAHPALNWEDVALDSSVYEGDRYRPQYHAIPPALWMNEPHSPFYYQGRYHVFYQHNPAGPYWAQIRWGHLVSDDMIHWEYVKDAVVPTAGVCPEGVWTGGACIGPDGTPWLAITAGTNTSTVSGQNVAFAHPADPSDPDLADWVVEDSVSLAQPAGGEGEIGQFRDPFVWYDDGVYYMMISTSIPGAGGSANVYTSTDMRDWTYKGYLFECDYNAYPEQGIHWECVVMLPISKKDGTGTKYVLFDCPQYPADAPVHTYYWIGQFDKNACRFVADDPKPRLFDLGGIFNGQNGYCFLTEEDIAAGKTSYDQGRSVVYAISQGKELGTTHNYYSGWAHNFTMPVELYLSDDGNNIIREPIRELSSLREETLYEYVGTGRNAAELNVAISSVRGDLLEIELEFTLSPAAETFRSGLSVRYNPTTNSLGTERTDVVFGNGGVMIDRTQTSLQYRSLDSSALWETSARAYSVRILLDRSMLEVYVNGIMSFTTHVYPKYGDSDYLRFFDEGAGMSVTKFIVRRLGSAYTETVTPAYYGNTGNLSDTGV